MNKLSKILCVILALIMLVSCSTGKKGTNSASSANSASKGTSSTDISSQSESEQQASSADSSTAQQVSSEANSAGSSSIVFNSGASEEFGAAFVADAEKMSNDTYGHPGNPQSYYETLSGERDPWLWPFSRASIWNMPIGSDAKFVSTNFERSREFSADGCYLLVTNKNDEYLEIREEGMSNRWPSNWESLRCFKSTYWPTGFTISKNSNMNDCSTILQPDGRTYLQMQPTCRHEADSTHVIGHVKYANRKEYDVFDIYDTGELGSHWGSGLSAIGGTIRLGELIGDEPMRHALKLNVWADKYLYWDETNKGFVWPADRSDTKSNSKGINPYLQEGSLLAIPKSVSMDSLGLKTEIGKKIFFALQNYGCYIVDDTTRDCFSLSIDYEAQEEVLDEYGIKMKTFFNHSNNSQTYDYGNDFMKMVQALKVVTNNARNNPGGGGTPCQPLAPNLPSLK